MVASVRRVSWILARIETESSDENRRADRGLLITDLVVSLMSVSQLRPGYQRQFASARWTDYTPSRRLIASEPLVRLVVDQDQLHQGGPDA